MPVILAIPEAEIRRITVQSQPRQIACETLSEETHHSTGGVAQCIGAEFKLQCWKKNSAILE
jgi:hypothetical protein